jgi:hypothetical protein
MSAPRTQGNRPYRLTFSDEPKLIEAEEKFFVWGKQAAKPRPWFWTPETWEVKGRILEPEELRILAYAALGNGAKGLQYYEYGTCQGYRGFDSSPRLLAEIGKLNHAIKANEPILSLAIPVTVKTIGSDSTGTRVYTLWSGEEGILVIARNLDCEPTQRVPNALGARPVFRCHSKPNVQIEIGKPAWFRTRAGRNGVASLRAKSLTSSSSPKVEVNGNTISVSLPNLSLAEAIFIPNPKGETL